MIIQSYFGTGFGGFRHRSASHLAWGIEFIHSAVPFDCNNALESCCIRLDTVQKQSSPNDCFRWLGRAGGLYVFLYMHYTSILLFILHCEAKDCAVSLSKTGYKVPWGAKSRGCNAWVDSWVVDQGHFSPQFQSFRALGRHELVVIRLRKWCKSCSSRARTYSSRSSSR